MGLAETSVDKIQMVDLHGQYLRIKPEIDDAIQHVLSSTSFIRGPFVTEFEQQLAQYLDTPGALGVANGTDALQVALMALGVGPGDEVITTAFTFIATAEAAALLGATPVFADIHPETFNIDPSRIEQLIADKTKAIVPVHLFGQPADMDPLMDVASRHNLPVVEDLAQAIGAHYKGRRVGSIGDVGTISFFPSKNLGAYGDAGAIVCSDENLLATCRMIGNHGSKKKYHNEIVGINSRLDAFQAAILSVKLKHLDDYEQARVSAADRYDTMLEGVEEIETPYRATDRSHVFHQYTLRYRPATSEKTRDGLSAFLKDRSIPNAVYYPIPLHQLPVFSTPGSSRYTDLTETELAAREVISLPMHTELTADQQRYIVDTIIEYVRG